VDYRKLNPFQKELKDLNKKEYTKLKQSIKRQFDFPFFIWLKEGNLFIIDGHQRHRVLMNENAYPYLLPAIYIDAETATEAAQKLLTLNSNYGKITKDGFDEFTSTYEINETFLQDFTTMDAFLDYELPEESQEIEEKNNFCFCKKCKKSLIDLIGESQYDLLIAKIEWLK